MERRKWRALSRNNMQAETCFARSRRIATGLSSTDDTKVYSRRISSADV